MAAHPFCIALTLSITQSNSQHSRPSAHGLTYAKNPGEATPSMIAFFGKPKVELPVAQNISDPILRGAGRAEPSDQGHNGGHTRSVLLIVGIVFAVLGIGMLGTAVVAYMIHARRSKVESSSSSLIGMSRHWRSYPEILGKP